MLDIACLKHGIACAYLFLNTLYFKFKTAAYNISDLCMRMTVLRVLIPQPNIRSCILKQFIEKNLYRICLRVNLYYLLTGTVY